MQVRLTKLTTAPATNSTDGSMTGDIIRVPKRDKNSRHRKQRHTVADLPFPRGGKYTQIWRKVFVPNLLAWAGSQDDPFGVNARVSVEAAKIWKRIFPDIELRDVDENILTYVVRDYSFMLFRLSIVF
jgi:hypothetical protein